MMFSSIEKRNSPAKNCISSSSEHSRAALDRELRRRRRRTKDAAVVAAPRLRGRGGGGSATPLLKWKFHDGPRQSPEAGGRRFRRVKLDDTVTFSARKLGAGLWWLVAPVTISGGGSNGMRWQWRNLDCFGVQFRSSLQSPKLAMEGASKWEPGSFKLSRDVHCCSGQPKPIENQQIETSSVASALQAQLMRAQKHLQVLETECRLSKKKLKQFLRKLSEERASQLRREHQKISALTEDLKAELRRERRNCERMGIFSSKLLTDLAGAKILAEQFKQKFEKERKARVCLEDVCCELAKEITNNKTEIEALKSECSRIQQEAEEEARMLKMVQVWREERIQMKLVDARLILEEKYCQINDLIDDLEILLRSRSIGLDMADQARAIREVVKSMNILDTEEFSYTPLKSDDIYAIIEDLKGNEAKDWEVEGYLGKSPGSYASEIQIVSPEEKGIISNSVLEHPNTFTNYGRNLRDASGRETVTCTVDPCSSHTPAESEHSVNRISRERHISCGRIQHEQNADQDSLISQTIEISSVSVKQSKEKGKSGDKLCRSLPSKDDTCVMILTYENGSFSNASTSDIRATSQGRLLGEGAHHRNNMEVQWYLPGPRNPNIARAMRGCIGWPCGIQRSSSKARYWEQD